jgi:hypothetical protein
VVAAMIVVGFFTIAGLFQSTQQREVARELAEVEIHADAD